MKHCCDSSYLKYECFVLRHYIFIESIMVCDLIWEHYGAPAAIIRELMVTTPLTLGPNVTIPRTGNKRGRRACKWNPDGFTTHYHASISLKLRPHEMTKITNINQSHKSYRKYKSENGRTRTSEYIRGGLRCHGGVSIPCWPVTPVVSPIFKLDKRYDP
jgi:hypothetical protein